MKEWKKPLVKVVIVEEDVIATSNQDEHQDSVGVENISRGTDIWS